MNIKEAEIIVNKYGEALSTGTGNGVARRKSKLPCSRGKIKLAYLIYIQYLVDNKMLYEEVGRNLTQTYAAIDAFIDDSMADEIDEIHRSLKNKNVELAPNQLKKFHEYAQKMANTDSLAEINDFISEIAK